MHCTIPPVASQRSFASRTLRGNSDETHVSIQSNLQQQNYTLPERSQCFLTAVRGISTAVVRGSKNVLIKYSTFRSGMACYFCSSHYDRLVSDGYDSPFYRKSRTISWANKLPEYYSLQATCARSTSDARHPGPPPIYTEHYLVFST
jgi:hypothetical protein